MDPMVPWYGPLIWNPYVPIIYHTQHKGPLRSLYGTMVSFFLEALALRSRSIFYEPMGKKANQLCHLRQS